MITIHWVLRLSPGWTAAEYDEWYLGQHTGYGKNSPDIVRYCVNRALADQPPAARGEAFRVAEECWDSFEKAEASWNAPLGHAVLGDAVANLGLLDAQSLPGIAVTEDREFEVARPAIFSTLKRGFKGSEDGTIVKFLAFGMSRRTDAAGWYGQSTAISAGMSVCAVIYSARPSTACCMSEDLSPFQARRDSSFMTGPWNCGSIMCAMHRVSSPAISLRQCGEHWKKTAAIFRQRFIAARK